MTTDSFVPADDPRASTPEALGAALSKPADEPTLAGPCPQPGCLRPTAHPGTRHRYSPTKELQPEPEPEAASLPELDKRPFAGPLESRPRNHAVSVIDAESGLYVAWDNCAGCHLHLTLCDCINGPKEPEYIRRWRERAFPINDPAKPIVPKVDDLVGIDPDWTGDLSTDEFIDQQRSDPARNLDENDHLTCRTCNAKYPRAGDGWDGECPSCADKTAKAEEGEQPEAQHETPADCQAAGVHLTSCDEDGYCNFCGHQDGGDEEPPMALTPPPDERQHFADTYDLDPGDLVSIPSTTTIDPEVGF